MRSCDADGPGRWITDSGPESVWLVLGASRGLGRRFAESALSRGRRVVATADHLEDLAGLVERFGRAVVPIEFDANDESQDRAILEQVIEIFGRIDVVVIHAGYDSGAGSAAERDPLDAVQTNLFAALWVCESVLVHMPSAGGGRIVLIAAPAREQHIGDPTPVAAQQVLDGFGERLARELDMTNVEVMICVPAEEHDGWLDAFGRRRYGLFPYD